MFEYNREKNVSDCFRQFWKTHNNSNAFLLQHSYTTGDIHDDRFYLSFAGLLDTSENIPKFISDDLLLYFGLDLAQYCSTPSHKSMFSWNINTLSGKLPKIMEHKYIIREATKDQNVMRTALLTILFGKSQCI